MKGNTDSLFSLLCRCLSFELYTNYRSHDDIVRVSQSLFARKAISNISRDDVPSIPPVKRPFTSDTSAQKIGISVGECKAQNGSRLLSPINFFRVLSFFFSSFELCACFLLQVLYSNISVTLCIEH